MIAELLAAAFPEDIFTGDYADDADYIRLKAAYHQFAFLVHPDTNADPQASEAFAKLTALFERAKEAITGGKWGVRAVDKKTTISFGKTTAVLTGVKKSGDLCDVFQTEGGDALKIPHSVHDNDLLQNEAEVLRAIWGADEEHAKKFLIDLKRSVKISYSGERVTNIFSWRNGFTLQEVMDKYPDGLDLRHAAWMWRRLIAASYVCHRNGFVHGTIKPDNFIIFPESHQGVLIDFTGAVKIGEKAKFAPGTQEFYAPEVLVGKPLMPATDLYAAAMIMKRLLGKTPINRATQGLINACLLKNGRSADAYQLHEDFAAVLFKIYGPPKFIDFSMT